MENKKIAKHYDMINATIYWKLHWKVGKPFTWSSGKVWGEREAADKEYMLFRCVEMLFRKVLHKTNQIDVYKKWGSIIRTDEDPVIVELYPTKYIPIREDLLDIRTKEFLDQTYHAINTGVPVNSNSKLKPVMKIKNVSMDATIKDIFERRYYNYDGYFKAKEYLRSIGAAPGCIQDFVNTIKIKQPELFTNPYAVTQTHDFYSKKQKAIPDNYIPASEFYADKQTLIDASKRLQEKFDLKNLPPGETLKSLLEKELQTAKKNM